jgi:hypothetical protein
MSDIMSQTPQPVNYTGMQIQADPIGAFQKAAALQNTQAQTGLLNADAQNVQQSALLQSLAAQRQQNYAQQYQNYLQNPTPEGARDLALTMPEVSANVQNAFGQYQQQEQQERLDTLGAVLTPLQNGRLDLAQQTVKQRQEAIENTRNWQSDPGLVRDMQGLSQMSNMIDGDMQNGTNKALGFTMLAGAHLMGPQDFYKAYGQAATMPATIDTANVGPAKAWADVGLTNAYTQDIGSAIQNRAAQFGLDQNRLQADVAFKLREMNYQQNAPYMQPDARAQADQDAVNSVSYGQMAQRMGNLAQQVGVLDQNGQWSSGVTGNVKSAWQNFWGTQDNVNTMKQEYSQVMGTLGAFGGAGLSKSDQKNLAPGIPPQNASPQQIQQFMQSFQNAELRAARISDAKSSWAYSYGRLGPATSDASIGGVQVAKGTSFSQFMNQLLKANSTAPSPFPAPNAEPGVQVAPQGGAQPAAQPAAPAVLTGSFARYNKYLTMGQ